MGFLSKQLIQLTHEDLLETNKEVLDIMKFREIASDIVDKKKLNYLNNSGAASIVRINKDYYLFFIKIY